METKHRWAKSNSVCGDNMETIDDIDNQISRFVGKTRVFGEITVEQAILEQSNSKYELQGEYVLPGFRDRSPAGKGKGNLFQKVMTGHIGNMISYMGRWRMRLEVPNAEIPEMLRLAGILSPSSDPPEFHGHCATSYEVVLDDFDLPGSSELKGRWRGSLDASGGGNGDIMFSS
ncbi:hypothetical protein OROGR_006388 [Orobanche gracilis]